MNKFHYLVPLVGLFIFGFFYQRHITAEAEFTRARLAQAEQQAAAAESVRQQAERQAVADAERSAQAQAEAEARAEADRLAAWETEISTLQADLASLHETVRTQTSEITQLKPRLETLHRNRQSARNHLFNLSQEVEKARIELRLTELETHRLLP